MSFDTEARTNRWDAFTMMTFPYFADEDYEVQQDFDPQDGYYELEFEDEEDDHTATFRYDGTPPHLAEEGMQNFQALFENSMDLGKQWSESWRQD